MQSTASPLSADRPLSPQQLPDVRMPPTPPEFPAHILHNTPPSPPPTPVRVANPVPRRKSNERVRPRQNNPLPPPYFPPLHHPRTPQSPATDVVQRMQPRVVPFKNSIPETAAPVASSSRSVVDNTATLARTLPADVNVPRLICYEQVGNVLSYPLDEQEQLETFPSDESPFASSADSVSSAASSSFLGSSQSSDSDTFIHDDTAFDEAALPAPAPALPAPAPASPAPVLALPAPVLALPAMSKFECYICGKLLGSRQALTWHLNSQVHNKDRSRVKICGINGCLREYLTPKSMDNHRASHASPQ